ncbi:MAG TPA: M56 family metallopeptidase [Bacteroidales bacterium]|nr:M56 family metallopeptidase [Bacteroidales bacterium]HRZ49029.1 M56 family metallopeptidase [Bacteroidales bacterium]
MSEFLFYLLKVAAGQLVLYGFYRLLLANGTHFRLNRLYMLAAVILPYLFPLIRTGFVTAGAVTSAVPALSLERILAPVEIHGNPDDLPWIRLLMILYGAGLLFALARLSDQAGRTAALLKRLPGTSYSGITLCVSREPIPPFSFFKWVCMDEDTFRSPGFHTVLKHEMVHVKQWHSLDVLLANLSSLLVWFNPVNRLMIHALKNTHEYLADAEVTEQTADKAGYCLLLLNQMVGVQEGFANYFNHSLTLKRMIMMTKSKSGRLAGLKVLLALPVVLLLIIAMGTGNRAGALISPADLVGPVANAHPDLPDDTVNYASLDKQPEFPGGQDAMIKFLIKNIRYPEAAREKGIQGTVYVQFTVLNTGALSDIKIKKGVNDLLDAEAKRVVTSMPDWIPGEQKGKKVNVVIVLPVNFQLENKKK